MNRQELAKQLHRAIELFAQNVTMTEEESMQIADMYEAWEANKLYVFDKIVKYGLDIENKSQLYRIVQEHTSQIDWTPEQTPALYKKIGFTEEGHPLWTQPLGAHDAYQTGDIVSWQEELWISTTNGNTWEPGVYGWTIM